MSTFLEALKSPAGKLLVVAVLWQLTFTAIGFALSPHQGIVGHMQHWDANWYLSIIHTHYSLNASSAAPAFYPLFPLIVGLLGLGFINPIIIGLIINTAALWLVILGLYRILDHFKVSGSASFTAIAVFLCFPSALFLHVFYGE